MQPLPPLSEASGFQASTKKGLSLRTFQELSPELAKELSDFDRDKDGTIDTHELLDIVREHKRREAELKNRAKRLTILTITVCVVSCIALAVLFGVVYGANEASKETKVGSSGSAKLSSNPRANLMVNKDTGEPVTVQNSEQTVRISRRAPLVNYGTRSRFTSLATSMAPMERRFWAKRGIVFKDQSRGLTSLQTDESTGESAEAPVAEEDPSQGVQVECPPNVVPRYPTVVPVCFLRYFDLGLTREEALRLYYLAQSDPTITAALTVSDSMARRFTAAQTRAQGSGRFSTAQSDASSAAGEGSSDETKPDEDALAELKNFRVDYIGDGTLGAGTTPEGIIMVPPQPIEDSGSKFRSRHTQESSDEENSDEVEVMMSLFLNGAVSEEKARFSSLQTTSSVLVKLSGKAVCREGCGYTGTAIPVKEAICTRCPAGSWAPAPVSGKFARCEPIPAGYLGYGYEEDGQTYIWMAVRCPRGTYNQKEGQYTTLAPKSSIVNPAGFQKAVSTLQLGRDTNGIPGRLLTSHCTPCDDKSKPCDPATGKPVTAHPSGLNYLVPTYLSTI